MLSIHDSYIKIMRLLSNDSSTDHLDIYKFSKNFTLFDNHFRPKGIDLKLKEKDIPLFPVPFGSTGENPKLVMLGINPGLSPESVAEEKEIAGNTYFSYADAYSNGTIIRFSSMEQKSKYYTHKVFPIALSLKYGEHIKYGEYKDVHQENSFNELIKDFNLMTIECIPYYSKKFEKTGNASEILSQDFYRQYADILFESLESNIEDNGTFFILYTPRQFQDPGHMASLYYNRYFEKLENVFSEEKFLIGCLKIKSKNIMLVVCKYGEQSGINKAEDKERFWQTVYEYRQKNL